MSHYCGRIFQCLTFTQWKWTNLTYGHKNGWELFALTMMLVICKLFCNLAVPYQLLPSTLGWPTKLLYCLGPLGSGLDSRFSNHCVYSLTSQLQGYQSQFFSLLFSIGKIGRVNINHYFAIGIIFGNFAVFVT